MHADLVATTTRQPSSPIQRIAAIIINWNRADLTIKAVRSIQGSVSVVYVLDNDSVDEDIAILEETLKDTTVILMKAEANLGYARGNNLAANTALAAGCDALLIMNNDAFAEPGAVKTLTCHLDAHPQVGVAMPTVISSDGERVLHGRCSLNRRTGTPGWEGKGSSLKQISDNPEPTDYVSGEAFLCRAEVVEQCGLFDERFFSYYEDVDWSLRVSRAGWRLNYVPSARFRHEWGGSGASAAGAYYRARNQILLHRYALGRTRAGAAVRSVRSLTRAAGVHLRHGRHDAVRQVASGLFAGLRNDDK